MQSSENQLNVVLFKKILKDSFLIKNVFISIKGLLTCVSHRVPEEMRLNQTC